MSTVTRSATASMDGSSILYAPQKTGSLYAGEALDPIAPCYIKASDGLVYMSNATAADEAAKFDGFTPKSYRVGDAVTLFGLGTRFRYTTGLTPGAPLYIGTTAGTLSDTPTTGCPAPIARVMNTTDATVVVATERTSIVFVSAEQTGTGSAQNVAHGLAATPTKVLIVPTDTAPATTGAYTATEGTHTSTNVVVTVTSGKKFKVWASL